MVKESKVLINEILEKERDKEIGVEDSEPVEKCITSFFDKINLAEQFIKILPMYYDESGLWWVWRENKLKWEMIDDVDVLNHLRFSSPVNIINAKERQETLIALRQVSRTQKPKKTKKTWVQFDKIIVDIATGDKFPAKSDYFITNPIPHKIGLSTDTPTLDKLFEEWVGKDYVETLYEIIAYCCLPDYPLERIFCLLGGGSNGKSCFLSLLGRFLGLNNICSTDLNLLMKSRFESGKLRDKLACLMGETDFKDIESTQLLKKLVSGKDTIGIEYKNKGFYNYINYAKLIVATNSLPQTSDKTVGFYRRWMIIDFPNQFPEEKDVLSGISDEELSNLSAKCIEILGRIITQRKFTNEGDYDERRLRYESKSNFLNEFLKNFTKESMESYITKSEFGRRFNEWCKSERHRELSDIVISKKMKKLNIEEGKPYMKWEQNGHMIRRQVRAWNGINWV